MPPWQTTHAARSTSGACGTKRSTRAFGGGSNLLGSTPAVVATTWTSSSFNAASAVAMSLPSSWNSVEQVTSTSGFVISPSHSGGAAGGSHTPGPVMTMLSGQSEWWY